MWNILRNQRWQWLLVICGLIICGAAYTLQQYAFPSQGTGSGQISVTVYVRNSTARLLLRSFVFPNDPADDYLAFSVVGPKGNTDPWLLVIQCPSERGFSPKHQVQLFPENAQSDQGVERVIALSQPAHSQKKQWQVPLGCFPAPPTQQTGRNKSGVTTEQIIYVGTACRGAWLVRFGCSVAPQTGGSTPGTATGQTINVTLPTLEENPSAQLTKVTTPIYAEDTANGTIRDLVEVYQAPGAVCPTSTPTSAPSPTDTNSAASGDDVGGSAPSSSPPSASPNPSTELENGTCYRPKLKNTNAIMYQIPASVETTETLENIDLAGDRVDSMFPPGQIESNDQIDWQGISGLSPSLNATNLAAEARNSEYSFFAGVLYGLGLSLIFAFVQICLSDAAKQRGG
jgi:hypothetical protein